MVVNLANCRIAIKYNTITNQRPKYNWHDGLNYYSSFTLLTLRSLWAKNDSLAQLGVNFQAG
jgi:hypothetical protein